MNLAAVFKVADAMYNNFKTYVDGTPSDMPNRSAGKLPPRKRNRLNALKSVYDSINSVSIIGKNRNRGAYKITVLINSRSKLKSVKRYFKRINKPFKVEIDHSDEVAKAMQIIYKIPVIPGDSVANVNRRAGTLSCIVEKDNEKYFLSNYHVFSDFDSDSTHAVAILKPGPLHGGFLPDNHIANFIDINPSSAIIFDPKPRHLLHHVNIDAALAKPLGPNYIDTSMEIPGIGKISGIKDIKSLEDLIIGYKVKISSWTSNYADNPEDLTATGGEIVSIERARKVEYPMGIGRHKVATFDTCMGIKGIDKICCRPGSSGSLILIEEDGKHFVIGLIFAGVKRKGIVIGYAHFIADVVDRLGIKFI